MSTTTQSILGLLLQFSSLKNYCLMKERWLCIQNIIALQILSDAITKCMHQCAFKAGLENLEQFDFLRLIHFKVWKTWWYWITMSLISTLCVSGFLVAYICTWITCKLQKLIYFKCIYMLPVNYLCRRKC